MIQRGRRNSLPVVALSVDALDRVPRQRAPHDLGDEETEIWVEIVNSQEAGWLTPAQVPMLAQYCRHVVGCRRIGAMIEQALSDSSLKVKDYNRLLAMQDRESRAVSSIATKLKMTNQSTTNHRGNKKQSAASRKPWEG